MPRVVILGAGPAGLAAAFELLDADLRDDVEIVVLEGEAEAGGRASSVAADDAELRAVCPEAPRGVHVPRALWSVGASDERTRALLGDELDAALGPASSGVAVWVDAPDLAAPAGRGGLLLTVRDDCSDPSTPADDELARAAGLGTTWARLRPTLFDERLTAGARWSLLHAAAWAEDLLEEDGVARLSQRLGGRAPDDVEAAQLRAPLFEAAARGVRAAHARGGDGALARLIAKDVKRLDEEAFEPTRSRLVLALADGAREGACGVSATSALAAVSRAGEPTQLVDGAAQQDVWRRSRERLEERMRAEGRGRVERGAWVTQILQQGARVSGVELTDHAERLAPPLPTTTAAKKGVAADALDADVVLATVPPGALAPLLRLVADEPQEELSWSLARLGRAHAQPVSLLVWPGFDVPLGVAGEGPSVVRDVGPWRTVHDLSRAWGREARRAVRGERDDEPVRGGGWLFAGAWEDLFVDDGRGLPHGAREVLRALAQAAEHVDPATIDAREPARATGPPVAAVHGEIAPLERTAWLERWVEQVAPLVASYALRALASLPGVQVPVRARLDDEAERVVRGRRARARFVLLRGGRLEARASSFAPGLSALRPSAAHATAVEGLWVAGDWTRGHDGAGPGVEASVRAGQRAARGIAAELSDRAS